MPTVPMLTLGWAREIGPNRVLPDLGTPPSPPIGAWDPAFSQAEDLLEQNSTLHQRLTTHSGAQTRALPPSSDPLMQNSGYVLILDGSISSLLS